MILREYTVNFEKQYLLFICLFVDFINSFSKPASIHKDHR